MLYKNIKRWNIDGGGVLLYLTKLLIYAKSNAPPPFSHLDSVINNYSPLIGEAHNIQNNLSIIKKINYFSLKLINLA